MSFLDDDRAKKPSAAQPGESLADLSIEDLAERITLYRAEIARLERDMEAKRLSRSAADAVFRTPAS